MSNDIPDISSRNVSQTYNSYEVMFDFICNRFVNNLITTGMLRYNDKPMKSNVIMVLLRCAKISLGSFIHSFIYLFIHSLFTCTCLIEEKNTEKNSLTICTSRITNDSCIVQLITFLINKIFDY